MAHTPLSRYAQKIEYCELTPDAGQEAVIAQLDALYASLTQPEETEAAKSLWERLMGRMHEEARPAVKGIYLWGGVGRGKSMLMDMFYECLDRPDARRVHFHGFMLEIHSRIHHYRSAKESDPLASVMDEVAAYYRILCFDELQVHDITDAMILARLFGELFARGCVILFTSNRPPEDLYLHGLQREQFLPFIALIREHMEVMEIASERDYRQGRLDAKRQRYFTPADETAERKLAALFAEYSAHQRPKAMDVPILGRSLHIEKSCRELVWFSFAELCDQPLGTLDYTELTQIFRTFFITDIPVMDADRRNSAKRFVHLVDILYEAGALLFCSAEAEPEALYVAGDGSFEFARTASRLREMMAEDYRPQLKRMTDAV